MIIRLFLLLILILNIVKGLSPEAIMQRIEQMRNNRKAVRCISWMQGIFDENGNLWLTWNEFDDSYTYWYIQKFNTKGEPFFQLVELAKRRSGGGISAPFFLGNSEDVYAFPGVNFRIIHVDSEGNFYQSKKSYSNDVYFGDVFFDSTGMLHVFSGVYGRTVKYNKFKVEVPLPRLVEERDLATFDNIKMRVKPEYRWLYHNIKYCDNKMKHTIYVNLPHGPLGPPFQRHTPWTDTTIMYISRVRWSDLKLVDTISFLIKDALYKKIRGCRLKLKESNYGQGVLVEGNSDTLLLYLPCRDTVEEIVDLVYLCKIKKDGTPIKTNKVIEEVVRAFDKAPDKLHIEIAFWGRDFGHYHSRTYQTEPSGGPNGMMIYGFDKSGNMYYYVWDKSDDYWKKK
jgi:hypothetical protein